MTTIDRPEVDFDAVNHAYSLGGEPVLGVSTIAKMGGAEDTWGVASAWGWRIGYEGAYDRLLDQTHGPVPWPTVDALRADLKEHRLTPWAVRDRAAERGSWVHDALEELGQAGEVQDPEAFRRRHGDEAAGHLRSLMRWYLATRPRWVALEVQVASRQHGFAGRYDVRALIDARRLLPSVDPIRRDAQAERIRELASARAEALCLVDLKTSKGVYPTSHMPQLEGYELASTEMGFPATDARLVLNTSADGTWDPSRCAVSWATADDFLGYLHAIRAIRRIKDADPEALRARAVEGAVFAALLPAPARARDLVGRPGLDDMDARAIGRVLGRLRRQGRVAQDADGAWRVS